MNAGQSQLVSAVEPPCADPGNGKRRRCPSVRVASFDDYDRIGALHLRNGLTPRTHQAWMALWKNNPAYEVGFPIGWVLETEAGEIVGSIENIPYRYYFSGTEIRAAACGGWVVDAAYRGHSLRLIQSVMRQPRVQLVLTTTAGTKADEVFKFLQWSKAPSGRWDQSWFWITNYSGFVRVAMRARRIACAALLAPPAGAALMCRDAVRNLRSGRKEMTGAIEPCGDFDGRFDEFWNALRGENKNALLAVRSRETLRWHFEHLLSGGRGWVLAVTDGPRLIAYAIFDRQDSPAQMLRRVRLIDFQALRGSEGVLLPVMNWMLRQCRREGVHVLENIGCWLAAAHLSRISAPYRRALPGWTFYYRALDRTLGEALKDPAVWSPSCFDGDVSL